MHDTDREQNAQGDQQQSGGARTGSGRTEQLDQSRAKQGDQPLTDKQQTEKQQSEAKQREAHGGRRSSEGSRERSGSDNLSEHGKMIMHDAQALTSSVQETAALIQRTMAEQVELRPYTTVGIAAGVGYLLGGGLASRMTGLALGTAYRLGLALAARELSSRVSIPALGLGAGEPNTERLSS